MIEGVKGDYRTVKLVTNDIDVVKFCKKSSRNNGTSRYKGGYSDDNLYIGCRNISEETDIPPFDNKHQYDHNGSDDSRKDAIVPPTTRADPIHNRGDCSASTARLGIVRLGSLQPLHDINSYIHVNFANYRQFYDKVGPIRLHTPLADGLKSPHVDIHLWNDSNTQLISQNSSRRKVYNVYWLPKIFSNIVLRAAIKFVDDCNIRDGRSIKREIECHLYMYQKLSCKNSKQSLIYNDDWPSVEVLGYYLDKQNPGHSTLVTRKLTGPDFFYIIRSENMNNFSSKITPIYEFNKLDWCITALNRVAQYGSVGIRHNDIKPDNIVLDVYYHEGVKKVDVKIIDLGAASMEHTKEFTGGTPWYESPEQKLLEYYTKKHRNHARAQMVSISQSSDAWGAGLSIVEVLVGRRVVDYIKAPYGPGALEFKGTPFDDLPEDEIYTKIDPNDHLWWNKDEYWGTPPEIWVQHAKRVLKLDDDGKQSICHLVSRFVFDHLVVVDPNKRSSVKYVAQHLRNFVTDAISQYT